MQAVIPIRRDGPHGATLKTLQFESSTSYRRVRTQPRTEGVVLSGEFLGLFTLYVAFDPSGILGYAPERRFRRTFLITENKSGIGPAATVN